MIVTLQKSASLFLWSRLGTRSLVSFAVADHAREGFVENGLESNSGQRRAFEVFEGSQFLDHTLGLSCCDGFLFLLGEFFQGCLVFSKIDLCSDQDYRDVGAMVFNLNIPTILNVNERRIVDNGETEQENVCLGVGKGSNSSITFLSSSIPERELNLLSSLATSLSFRFHTFQTKTLSQIPFGKHTHLTAL